jgi:hypothetical protein
MNAVNGDPTVSSPGFYFEGVLEPTGEGPTFALDTSDPEGPLVWWFHDCTMFLGENGAPIPARVHARLPISPPGWALLSADPLTLDPSILCHRCQTHGYIRNGAWVAV